MIRHISSSHTVFSSRVDQQRETGGDKVRCGGVVGKERLREGEELRNAWSEVEIKK